MVVMYAVGDAHIYTCIVVVQYRIREKMITIVRPFIRVPHFKRRVG